jgi:hypothetical protein
VVPGETTGCADPANPSATVLGETTAGAGRTAGTVPGETTAGAVPEIERREGGGGSKVGREGRRRKRGGEEGERGWLGVGACGVGGGG